MLRGRAQREQRQGRRSPRLDALSRPS